MNERLNKVVVRLDALTLRERMFVFAAAVAVIVGTVYLFLLRPVYAEQSVLRTRLGQQQANIAGIDQEVAGLAAAHQNDPDAADRATLAARRAAAEHLQQELRSLQNGLVQPGRMVPLLERLLRSNGRVKLVGLRTLPATGVGPDAATPAPAAGAGPVSGASANGLAGPLAALVLPGAAAPAQPANGAPARAEPPLLYRHGVELTLQGNYLDLLAYLQALEAVPGQFLWGRTELDARDFPADRLTVTLYTISLEESWLQL